MYKQTFYHLIWLILLVVGCTGGEPSFADLSSNHQLLTSLPTSVNGQPLPSLAPMLEKVTPAVVNISSTEIKEVNNPLFNDPFFRYFFNILPEKRKAQSRGSGVVIDAYNGYVVTNHHVIDNATEIKITLQDGRELDAKLMGTDPETDIALLKITTNHLIALSLANSDKLRVGDFVVAIGNPFGLGQTVTSGIVSALGRSGLGIEGYEDFIQTDASINPGNSGGALVDLRGELVGLNTAIIAPGGGNVGIGFAIPSNMVQKIVQQLAQFGEVQRGVLGIQVQDLTPELANAFGLEKRDKGAIVVEVGRGSPAEEAGIERGDVVIAINNQTVNKASDIHNRVGLLRIGEKVSLSVLRKGHSYEFHVTIGALETTEGRKISSYLEGSQLREIQGGVQVYTIKQGSVAWKLGLREGDVVIAIDRRRIENLEELKQAFQRRELPLMIQINRDNEVMSIILR